METPDHPSRKVNISEVLDAGAWTGYQKIVLVFAALAFLMDGVANQALGLAIPALTADWGLSREAFASVFAIGLIGLTIGSAVGGMLGDRYGRRRVLIASVAIFGVMTLLASMAQNLTTLFWLRFVDGLGIGAAIPTGAALISEFTPMRKRPLAIALGMVFIAVGAVFAGLFASAILPTLGWRGLFVALGVAPLLLAVVFAIWLPETPLYLARQPARKKDLVRIMSKCGFQVDETSEIEQEVAEQKQKIPVKSLFESDVRVSTIALWLAFFFVLLSSYTMFSWVPAMLASLDFPLSMTSLGITAFSIGGVAGGILSGWMIEYFGSRLSVLGLAAGAILGALILGGLIYIGVNTETAIFAALAFEGFFISGLHNGLYTLAAFLYPHFARGTGVGAAAAVGRLGAIVSSFSGVLALKLGGATGYFLVIAFSIGVAFVCLAIIKRHIPGSGALQRGAQVSTA